MKFPSVTPARSLFTLARPLFTLALAPLALALLACCGNSGVGGGSEDPGAQIDLIRPDPEPLADGVVTLAGGADPGLVDGLRQQAAFFNPVNLVALADGSLIVCDFDNNLLRKVTTDGTVSTLAPPEGFNWPFGIALAPDGMLYVETDVDLEGDAETGVLWRVDSRSGAFEAIAENFGVRRGLVTLRDGRLVATSHRDHTLRFVDVDTGELTLLAGAADEPGDANGTGAAARFSSPYGVVQLSNGDLIVADKDNNLLRRVTLAGVVTTFAGDGQGDTRDGLGTTASFNQPQALAVAADDTIYLTEAGGYVVRRVDSTGAVTTLAGSGTAGHRDDSDPLEAQFFGLEGIAIDPTDTYLYVADGNRGEEDPYHRVRRIALPH